MLEKSAIFHDGVLYTGRRHCDCFDTIYKVLDYEDVLKVRKDGIQGFVDENYEFYDRRQAFEYAIIMGQIAASRIYSKRDYLMSEDLW